MCKLNKSIKDTFLLFFVKKKDFLSVLYFFNELC